MGNSKSKKLNTQFFETTPLRLLLEDAAFKGLVSKFGMAKFNPGADLCSAGQSCHNFYMVKSGQVVIHVKDDSGGDVFVCNVSEGAVINPEVLKGEHAEVTARAVDAVSAFVLPQKTWEKWHTSHQADAEKLMAVLSPDVKAMWADIPFVDVSTLSPSQLLHLRHSMVPRAYMTGSTVYKEKDTEPELAANMFIVYSGGVKASRAAGGADIGYTEKGKYFGELALLMLTAREETVTATQNSVVFAVSKGAFFSFLKKYPEVQAHYVKHLKPRLSEHFKQSKSSLFEGVSEDQVSPLMEGCEWELCDKDKNIFNEGDIGDSFYILLFGELGVYVRKEGTQTQVNKMGPGQYFGEIALVTDKPRTATITCHTESVILTMTKERFEEVFASAPEFLANFQIKLAPANVELKHILWHSYGLECFVKQMQAEYSEENIMFWKDCRSFKDHPEGSKEQKEAADYMYNEYIKNGARLMVNLKGLTKQALVKDIKDGNIHSDMFKKAMEEIFSLMERDSFARFKSGPHFAAFLKQVGTFDEVAELAQTRMDVQATPNTARRNQAAAAAAAAASGEDSTSQPNSTSGPTLTVPTVLPGSTTTTPTTTNTNTNTPQPPTETVIETPTPTPAPTKTEGTTEMTTETPVENTPATPAVAVEVAQKEETQTEAKLGAAAAAVEGVGGTVGTAAIAVGVSAMKGEEEMKEETKQEKTENTVEFSGMKEAEETKQKETGVEVAVTDTENVQESAVSAVEEVEKLVASIGNGNSESEMGADVTAQSETAIAEEGKSAANGTEERGVEEGKEKAEEVSRKASEVKESVTGNAAKIVDDVRKEAGEAGVKIEIS